MEWSIFLDELGGGVTAVVIIGLSFFSWTVLKWLRDDAKEARMIEREMHASTLEGLAASTAAIRDLTEEVRRNGN